MKVVWMVSCLSRKMSGEPRALMARARPEHEEEREDNGPSTERNSLASDAAADGGGDESPL
jgi:hypothetical protein